MIGHYEAQIFYAITLNVAASPNDKNPGPLAKVAKVALPIMGNAEGVLGPTNNLLLFRFHRGFEVSSISPWPSLNLG